MKINFICGMFTGVLVGSAITMLLDPVSDKDRKRIHKGTRNVIKKASCVLDMMRL